MMHVALVSCVKKKADRASAAEDLYLSPLFRGLRRYAERHANAWYILSAQYGLLRPDKIVSPYERTLNAMSASERVEWAARVQHELVDVLPAGTDITLLAGKRYRERIEPFLRDRGFSVSIPLAGLGIGKQLQWLKRNSG